MTAVQPVIDGINEWRKETRGEAPLQWTVQSVEESPDNLHYGIGRACVKISARGALVTPEDPIPSGASHASRGQLFSTMSVYFNECVIKQIGFCQEQEYHYEYEYCGAGSRYEHQTRVAHGNNIKLLACENATDPQWMDRFQKTLAGALVP